MLPLFVTAAPPAPEPVTTWAEFMERYERRSNRDFSTANDERADIFSRWRFGAEWKFDDQARLVGEFQYSHNLFWTPARNGASERQEASLFFVEAKSPSGTWTVGRQKLALGDERLIGNFEWNHIARRYDGVRWQGKDVQAFGAAIGVAANRPRDARLLGVSGKTAGGEASLIYKHDKPTAGNVDHVTLDYRAVRKAGQGQLTYEAAVQVGEVSGRDHAAWAFHSKYEAPAGEKTRFGLELNGASGGPATGDSRTFDNLYPTNHAKYGLADMQGWRNTVNAAAMLKFEQSKKLSWMAAYRGFWLQDDRDAWYGAGGGRNGAFVDPTGTSGSAVGTELDFEAVFTGIDKVRLAGGLAFFFPGSFVKSFGARETQTWAYVQASARF